MWLSPRQIQIIPVGRGFFEYAEEVQKIFKDAGFWVDVDLSGETLQKKVRRAQLAQYNFVFSTSPPLCRALRPARAAFARAKTAPMPVT